MARPSILTDVLIAEFCSKLRISGSIETAIKSTGIGRESYYGWARKYREGGASPMVKRFMRAVEEAEGETKLLREHMLTKHFDKNWQALAWWLERKYSPEYGQRRPPPLADPDAAAEEREVERVVWAKAAPAKKAPAEPAEAAQITPEPPPDKAPAPDEA
jgi:hypothetical protein